MIPRLLVLALGKIVGFPVRMKLWQFAAACRRPHEVQDALLRQIIADQADTGFGRDHGFASIKTLADFRRQLPISGYDALEPYIARVRRGETRALLADERVLMFALTSGTAGTARKTIPITPRYLADYKRGWNRWGLRALLDHQRISCSPILQIAGDPEEYTTEAGIPCGSLSGLTVRMQKRIIRFLYTFPASASGIGEHAAKQYVALRLSMGRRVGMIIAPNPSTLASLARTLNERKEDLLRDLRDGTLSSRLPIPDDIRAALQPRLKKYPRRARELDAIASTGELWPRDVWPPSRMLLGTWTGGSVGPYLSQLKQYYGDTYVRDLGLLASEGRMSIPLADGTKSGVLDVTAHYFEFIPEAEIDSNQPTVLGAHEVEVDRNYYLVPTTAAGLYRYDLRDLVRVTGFYGRTPLIEFLGKGSSFASLTGEKLSEHQVTHAVADVFARRGLPLPVYALAPVWDERQPYYALVLERTGWNRETEESIAAAIDAALGERNVEYRSKRDSGRLGPVRIAWIAPGTWTDWDRERLERTGGSVDQYKHPCLVGDLAFSQEMMAS